MVEELFFPGWRFEEETIPIEKKVMDKWDEIDMLDRLRNYD